MAFHDDADKLTASSKPIFLMSVTLTNSYRTRFRPELKVVDVERHDSAGKPEVLAFAMDGEGTVESEVDDAPPRYLVRMELDPGAYEVRGMVSRARGFPIVGQFFVPLHLPLTSKEPGVFYLGHVDAEVRERVGDEFRAGPVIPLIDQAIAGASGGTFDVRISDAFATDEALLRKTFPQLGAADIRKAILPPFDRGVAQKWWEDH